MHLSVETVDAPAAAIAAAVAKVADDVAAAPVVLGTNNVLVRPWAWHGQAKETPPAAGSHWTGRCGWGGAVHATRLARL